MSGTPLTEVGVWSMKPGVRSCWVQSAFVCGRQAAYTSLTALVFRMRHHATASTSGSAITPTPAQNGYAAAVTVIRTGQTAGATLTNGPIFACGPASPYTWMPANEMSQESVDGGAAASLDLWGACGVASLIYEWAVAHGE